MKQTLDPIPTGARENSVPGGGSGAVLELRPMTEVERAIAQMREMAKQLLLQAQALEATIEIPKQRSRVNELVCPRTGKRTRIKTIPMERP